jgi:hypothetical protein
VDAILSEPLLGANNEDLNQSLPDTINNSTETDPDLSQYIPDLTPSNGSITDSVDASLNDADLTSNVPEDNLATNTAVVEESTSGETDLSQIAPEINSSNSTVDETTQND